MKIGVFRHSASSNGRVFNSDISLRYSNRTGNVLPKMSDFDRSAAGGDRGGG